jgi:hypothetical protein
MRGEGEVAGSMGDGSTTAGPVEVDGVWVE